MIEVPSAAVMADLLAEEVDFFSIGTNDLTQYTLAVDRTNPVVAPLADALHPAVLRLIRQVVEAAHEKGRWVGVCGELAGDPLATPVLVGLSVDELSMSLPSVPIVKSRIRALSWRTAELARECLPPTTPPRCAGSWPRRPSGGPPLSPPTSRGSGRRRRRRPPDGRPSTPPRR